MKIPTYGHQVPVSLTRPPIRKPYKVSPGRRFLQALQFVTGTAAQYMAKFENAAIQDEYSEAKVGTLKDMNTFMLKLSKDPDYLTHLDKLEKESFEIYSKRSGDLKYDESKKAYKKMFDESMVTWRKDVMWNANTIGNDLMRVHYNDDCNILERLGNKKELEIRIQEGLNQGVVTPANAAIDKKERFHRIDFRETETKVLNILHTEGPVPAVKYLYSDEVPESIITDDILRLRNRIKSELDMIQAEKAQELERLRTELQKEIVQTYSTGDVTELRKLRGQILNLKILPPVGTHSQKWWVDEIDTKIKTYLDAMSKGETDPNTQYNPVIYADMLRVAYDDTLSFAEKEERIMSNMGADAQGNPRLRAKEDVPTLKGIARAEKSFTVKMAFKSFDLALTNEIITPIEFIDIAIEFNKAVESGDFTEEGLRQEAKNLLVKVSEGYLKEELDKNVLPFKKKKTREYIEEHPPEKRPIKEKPKPEPGSPKDFESFFNITEYESKYYEDVGLWIYTDGKRLYSMINGKWHTKGPEDEEWKEYSGKKDFIPPKWY